MKRFAILAGLVLFALGCADEDLQGPTVVRVSQINDGAPLQADVIIIVDDQTGETAVPEDVVVVQIQNKAYNGVTVVDPSTFVNDFQVTRYTVTWRRADGGPTAGTGWTLSDFDFEAATTVIVPGNGFAEFGVLVAPAGMKTVDPFVQARVGAYIKTIADFDIVGHYVIRPDVEIHLSASLSVNFADFADDEPSR